MARNPLRCLVIRPPEHENARQAQGQAGARHCQVLLGSVHIEREVKVSRCVSRRLQPSTPVPLQSRAPSSGRRCQANDSLENGSQLRPGVYQTIERCQ